MTFEQILGYARAVLESFGLTTAISVIVFVSVAVYIYDRFFRRD
jgi:hypothetical protein